MSNFQAAIQQMKQKRKQTSELIGTFVEAEAKHRVPVDTGDLRRKITHTTEHADNFSKTQIGTNVEYAQVVEEGSSPHKIRSKDGKPIRMKINGKWVTVDEINHPGTKPQPYLKPSITENIGEIQQKIREVLGI